MSHKPAAIPVVANTHRAFIMVDGYNKQVGKDVFKWVSFDKPKHKLIASGSYEFCLEKMLEYGMRYKHNGPAGVEEHKTPGNPWSSEWVGVAE